MAQLHSNDAINAIKGLSRALHFDKGYKTIYEGISNGSSKQSFEDAAKKYLYDNGELSMTRVAGAGVGGMIGLRAGFGAFRGTFTDSNGNFDAPGIPGI